MPEKKEQSFLQLRKLQKFQLTQRLRILLIIGVLLLILIVMVIWASIRLGGFSNIFKGNGNIVTNTVNNISSINSTSTPTPTPTKFTITDIPNSQDVINESTENAIVFSTGQDIYSITIKAGTTLELINNSDKAIGLQFSDGRQTRVEVKGTNYETFIKTGTYTFKDQIDIQSSQITGSVTVIK